MKVKILLFFLLYTVQPSLRSSVENTLASSLVYGRMDWCEVVQKKLSGLAHIILFIQRAHT